MISLFALVMAIGIVVDAIVVIEAVTLKSLATNFHLLRLRKSQFRRSVSDYCTSLVIFLYSFL